MIIDSFDYTPAFRFMDAIPIFKLSLILFSPPAFTCTLRIAIYEKVKPWRKAIFLGLMSQNRVCFLFSQDIILKNSNLKSIVGPWTEFHFASLIVEREPCDVDFTCRFENARRNVEAGAVVSDDNICRIRSVEAFVSTAMEHKRKYEKVFMRKRFMFRLWEFTVSLNMIYGLPFTWLRKEPSMSSGCSGYGPRREKSMQTVGPARRISGQVYSGSKSSDYLHFYGFGTNTNNCGIKSMTGTILVNSKDIYC